MKNVSGFSLVSPFQALLPKTVGTDIVLWMSTLIKLTLLKCKTLKNEKIADLVWLLFSSKQNYILFSMWAPPRKLVLYCLCYSVWLKDVCRQGLWSKHYKKSKHLWHPILDNTRRACNYMYELYVLNVSLMYSCIHHHIKHYLYPFCRYVFWLYIFRTNIKFHYKAWKEMGIHVLYIIFKEMLKMLKTLLPLAYCLQILQIDTVSMGTHLPVIITVICIFVFLCQVHLNYAYNIRHAG
jgi:hypothetical protein